MADYFTSFSCCFNVGTTQNAARALELYQTMHDQLVEADGSGFGFLVELDPNETTSLWIHDGGCGDTDHVLSFVKACGAELGLSGCWGFEWAYTCSKPRLDAFGGGAHVIDLQTGETIAWLSTNEWLTSRLSHGVDDRS